MFDISPLIIFMIFYNLMMASTKVYRLGPLVVGWISSPRAKVPINKTLNATKK